MTSKSLPSTTPHVDVAIIGTGFAGLGMAARLAQRGHRDFVVLERASELGGVWRDNTYPGAACDIRSDLYSFSFAPNPNWTRSYGTQPEILAYLQSVAERFELTPQLRFDHDVQQAVWDDGARLWRITTSQGALTARVLVSGHGPLVEPVWPAIEGLDDFAGPRFHSARWRHDVELAGQRVAVIGTGASAIQLVPEVQKVAGHLTVFQRSAPWIIPRHDVPTTPGRRARFAARPWLQRIARRWQFLRAEVNFLGFAVRPIGATVEKQSLGMLKKQVADPALRAKLTPDYRIGCKRILISNAYYPALAQPNATVETSPIVRVEKDAIVTADGTRHEVDVIIGSTGFNATQPPIAQVIRGREGRSLAETWSPHAEALRGTTVAGFPNLFLLIGPNTVLAHNSMVHIIEAQLDYILQAVDAAGTGTVEPTPAAQQRWTDSLQRAFDGSVWTTGGCTSYYTDAAGRNTALWPHGADAFARAVRRFDRSEYVFS